MDETDDERRPDVTGEQSNEGESAAEVDPSTETVRERLETGGASAYFDQCRDAAVEQRKELLRSCELIADDQPAKIAPLCPALRPFLDDDERSVRLCAAKLFVTVAEDEPAAVADIVPALADRLGDGEELSYVRARAAEGLGYVALDRPEAVSSPAILAELHVGLRFEDIESRAKLAKALEYIAIGDPDRLRHKMSTLAERADDESELVRYHLTTALVAVGCAHPERLAAVAATLARRLDDESQHVRGRAAEAFGLLADNSELNEADKNRLTELTHSDASFVTKRAQFALGENVDGVGTLSDVRASTEPAVETISTPESDGECPACGLDLPANGPPLCPRCGSPY